MRTAILICGQLRTFTNVWDNMKKHLVNPLEADVFIYTWSNTGYGNRTLGLGIEDKDVDVNELKNLTNCKKIFVKDYEQEFQTKLDDVEIPQKLIELEPIHHRNNLPLWYTLYKCNELKKEYENENDFKYDCVVKVRPDIWFDSELPSQVFEHLDHLLQWDFAIGKGFQVCDKMALSNSENMDYYCSVWENLNDYYKDLGNNFKQRPIGERLLYRHFTKCNIPVGSFTTNAYIKHVSFLSKEENMQLRDNKQ